MEYYQYIKVGCTTGCIQKDANLNQILKKELKDLSRGHLLRNVVEAKEELDFLVLNVNVDL